MLDVLEEGAGPAGDDDGGLVCCQLLLHRLVALRQVIGVHYPDPFDADAAAQALQVDLGAGPLEVEAGGGVLLDVRSWPVIELSRMMTVELDSL